MKASFKHKLIGLALAVLFPLQLSSAQAPLGTWTGLDKSIHGGQLHELKLDLQEASTEEAAIFPRLSPLALPALEKRILAGSMEFRAETNRGKAVLRETREVLAAYFPEIRMLSLHFKYGNRLDPRNAYVGIYDAQERVIAFFHLGMAARDSLPYILQAGRTPPQDLKQLAAHKSSPAFQVPANPANVFQAAQQRKQAQQTLQRQQELILKYQPKLQALQQEMVSALAAGNHELAQAKQLELQELALTLRAIQRGEIPPEDFEEGAVGSTGSAASTGCPEEILGWMGEVEDNGESHHSFSGMVRLGNFFRDAYFVPHFGKPFSEFSRKESMKVARDFQSRCLVPGNTLHQSRYGPTLSGAFSDAGQYGRFDVISTARALDILADWQEETANSLAGSVDLEVADAFELIRSGITTALWPKEQERGRELVAEVMLSSIRKAVFAELGTISERLQNSDTEEPILELMMLRYGKLWSKIPEGRQTEMEQAFWEEVEPSLGRYLQNRLQAFSAKGNPRETLVAGKRWMRSVSDALNLMQDSSAYRKFVKDFSIQRQQAYEEAKDRLAADLETISAKRAAVEFSYPFELGDDVAISAAWRGVKKLQQERIQEIDWQAYLDRVGDGPFGPDYPGAVYLNAVYRGDVQTMRQEDMAYQKQIREYLSPLLNSDIMASMDVLMSSMFGNDTRLSNAFLNGIADTHGYDSLLACFVVKYHGVYGNCAGRPTVVIPVTTITTTVQQFSDGTSNSYESGRETNYHTVLQDHSAAWREFEGKYSDPQLMRYAAMLSKAMSPEGKDLNLGYKLADAIEGLIKAMRSYPCDHEVTQRMEANLLDLFNGRIPSRNGPVDTSWKQR